MIRLKLEYRSRVDPYQLGASATRRKDFWKPFRGMRAFQMEGNVEVDCHSLSHRDANFTPLAEDRDPPNAVSTPIHLSKHQALNI